MSGRYAGSESHLGPVKAACHERFPTILKLPKQSLQHCAIYVVCKASHSLGVLRDFSFASVSRVHVCLPARSALDEGARPRISPIASTTAIRMRWLKTALTGAHKLQTACDDNRFAEPTSANLCRQRVMLRPIGLYSYQSNPLCHIQNAMSNHLASNPIRTWNINIESTCLSLKPIQYPKCQAELKKCEETQAAPPHLG